MPQVDDIEEMLRTMETTLDETSGWGSELLITSLEGCIEALNELIAISMSMKAEEEE